MEIQVNGGTVAKKLAWARETLEQQMPVNQVFGQDEMNDVIGVTKAKGYKGSPATGRHTKELPCKTHGGCARLSVLGPAILPERPSLWLGLGRKVTITAQRSARSTRLARATSCRMASSSRTMLPPVMICLIRASAL